MSFNGDDFKGIDDDLVRDYASQNTLADHMLRNNEYWHHKNDGVRCTMDYWCASNLAGAGSGVNDLIHASFEPAMLWRAPFLVRPGLKQIKVYMWGTVANASNTAPYDVFVNLQIFGVGMQGPGKSPPATWTGDATDTPALYSITYELDQPVRAEFETDLVLWMQCSPAPTTNEPVSTPVTVRDNRWTTQDQIDEFDQSGNEIRARAHILRAPDPSSPLTSAVIVDVQRSWLGASIQGSLDQALTIQSDLWLGNLNVYQDYCNYVAPRSFYIEETRDEL